MRSLAPSLVLLAVAASAGASTYLVLPDGSGDVPGIADALQLAVSGDVIELGDGAFRGLGNAGLDFEGKAIMLRSRSGNPRACVIDGAESPGASILSLVNAEGMSTVIEGLGFRGASAGDVEGGALRLVGSSPRVTNCRFTGNLALQGAAVYCEGGAPRFESCVFSGNQASNDGGGLAATGGANVTLSGCRLERNGAGYGGAIQVDQANIAMSGCVFFANVASQRGGAVYGGDHASLNLAACTLAYNAAPTGAGLSLVTSASADLVQSIVAFGAVGEAVELRFSASATASCSDIYGNAGGDWTGPLAALEGQDGNLSADPRFCGDAESGDLGLADDSPCTDTASACGAMGAAPVTCSGQGRSNAVSIGAVKVLYGDREDD